MRQGMLNMWANPGTGIQAQKPVLPPAKKMIHLWAGMQGLQTGFPLKKNEKKFQILALQKALNAKGAGLKEDGVLGPGTMNAMWKVSPFPQNVGTEMVINPAFYGQFWDSWIMPISKQPATYTDAELNDTLQYRLGLAKTAWQSLVNVCMAFKSAETKLGVSEMAALRTEFAALLSQSKSKQSIYFNAIYGGREFAPDDQRRLRAITPNFEQVKGEMGHDGVNPDKVGRIKNGDNIVQTLELKSPNETRKLYKLATECAAMYDFILSYAKLTNNQVINPSQSGNGDGTDLGIKIPDTIPGLPGSGGQNQTNNTNPLDQLTQILNIGMQLVPFVAIFFGIKFIVNATKSFDKNTKF